MTKKDRSNETLSKILSAPIESTGRPQEAEVPVDVKLQDVSITDNIYKSLQDWCTEHNHSIEDVINDIVFDFLFAKGSIKKLTEHYIKIDDLESQAVNLINRTLPSYVKDFADDMCEMSLKIPRWQHLMGVYRLAFDMSLFPQPLLDPGWEEHADRVNSMSKCPKCREMFKPGYIGQLYCSNKCGAEARQGIS